MQGLTTDHQLNIPAVLRRREPHRYTFADASGRTRKLASALQKLGRGAGARVAAVCGNRYSTSRSPSAGSGSPAASGS